MNPIENQIIGSMYGFQVRRERAYDADSPLMLFLVDVPPEPPEIILAHAGHSITLFSAPNRWAVFDTRDMIPQD
jgi:hypothetical protein